MAKDFIELTVITSCLPILLAFIAIILGMSAFCVIFMFSLAAYILGLASAKIIEINYQNNEN